ncbi:vitelline membrane outer layer protein 1 homolog isoform X3 [Dreissena polymorpha]|uniref:vitelline membrane outer layer protein 1 homolog isoform X3 n=1 Tax=Dreissena polymorpha TaxID=45954 RepID=UPI00226547FA|nr:vitelline membrane outer layer protein 1 homolog isoform X3 [Dreissena polymorpha]
MMLHYVVASLTLLWTCHAQFPRAVTDTLRVINGGPHGIWTTDEFCPPHQFAVGYDMKIQYNQFTGDDTSLNAIALFCSDIQLRYYGEKRVTSGQSQFGALKGGVICKPIGTAAFLTAFEMEVEGDQGDLDDTAAGYVKFKCTNMADDSVQELNMDPGYSFVGAWGDWSSSCPHGSAICGLKTRIEPNQGSGDDTALNDVIFYCCSFTESGAVVGK